MTTALYLITLSDNKKTARNFSFFAACCGASYLLYAGVLGITNPFTVGSSRMGSFVASLTGLLVMVLFIVRNKAMQSGDVEERSMQSGVVEERSMLFSKDSLDFINGTHRYRQHINKWAVLEVLVAVLFYTYTVELLSMLFSHCVLITGSYRYHAEALIPYGIGFMLASLQWSYYYKHWTSAIRTVLSTVLLVTGLIISLLIFRHDACSTPQLLESWYMIPVIALLTGQSVGSVTCETYTVMNIAWSSRAKFSVLVVIETVWALCFFLLFREITVTIHISVLSILGISYCFSVMSFQKRAKKFYQRMDSYLTKNVSSSKTSTSKYGSTYLL